MTMMLRKGRYAARFASSDADIARAQRLRHRCFFERGQAQERPGRLDCDAFDAPYRHVLIEDGVDSPLPSATFRFAPFSGLADLTQSYAAQFYDLTGFSGLAQPMAEIGRFCIDPGAQNGEALRAAWGALAGLVREGGVAVLFGCASFEGADPALHAAALAHLQARHLGPACYRPRAIAPQSVRLSSMPPGTPRQTLAQLPPLLRSYLAMGGWVSDTAVIDTDLDTLHVFTALEIASVPPARARSLLALGG